MIPFLFDSLPADGSADKGMKASGLPFEKGTYIFVPNIRKSIEEKSDSIKAYGITGDSVTEFTLSTGGMTDDERKIILDGCLINFYKR